MVETFLCVLREVVQSSFSAINIQNIFTSSRPLPKVFGTFKWRKIQLVMALNESYTCNWHWSHTLRQSPRLASCLHIAYEHKAEKKSQNDKYFFSAAAKARSLVHLKEWNTNIEQTSMILFFITLQFEWFR